MSDASPGQFARLICAFVRIFRKNMIVGIENETP